jgi:hypothetical protein
MAGEASVTDAGCGRSTVATYHRLAFRRGKKSTPEKKNGAATVNFPPEENSRGFRWRRREARGT